MVQNIRCKKDKINSFKTAVRNPSWNILGADLVNKSPNIKEELNILAFKRKHVILSGGVIAFYGSRPKKKKKIELKKNRGCWFKS